MGADKSEQLEFWRVLEPILVRSGWEHIAWTSGHTVPLGPYNSPIETVSRCVGRLSLLTLKFTRFRKINLLSLMPHKPCSSH